MGHPLRKKRAKDLKRQRDGLHRMREKRERPTCPDTGKVMYRFESDVLMAYRASRTPTRAYLCGFCDHLHATSRPLKTRQGDL